MTPAAAQTTDNGKVLTRLASFQGRLYPAYGDYGANTGPIDLLAFDLAGQIMDPVELVAHAEQTWTMREFGGSLYVPYLDPQDGNDHPEQGQYAVATAPGSWTVVTSVLGVTHAFDMAETSDGLWAFGSNESYPAAVIWRSADGGETWAEALNVPGGNFARFYVAATFGDDMLAFLNENEGLIDTNRVYRWTRGGTEWTVIDAPIATMSVDPSVCDAPCRFSMNGVDFWLGLVNGRNTGTVVGAAAVVITHPDHADQAEAILAALPTNALYDAASTDTACYLLTGTGDVLAGDTAGNWTALLTLTDDTVRSIAVDPDGGYFYFGTTDSRILRTPIPG